MAREKDHPQTISTTLEQTVPPYSSSKDDSKASLYVQASEDGIVRLDSSTPANIVGVYTEGLESCVAIIFYNEKAQRLSFMHKSMISAPSVISVLDREFMWVLTGVDNQPIEFCRFVQNDYIRNLKSTLIYVDNQKYKKYVEINRKWVEDNYFSSLSERGFSLTSTVSKDGFCSCQRSNGKISIKEAPGLQKYKSPNNEKRNWISRLNNHFKFHKCQFDKFGENRIEFNINTYARSLPHLTLPFERMLAEFESPESKNTYYDKYSWLWALRGRVCLCFKDNSLILDWLEKNQLNEDDTVVHHAFIQLPLTLETDPDQKISGFNKLYVVAFSIDWLKLNPGKTQDLLSSYVIDIDVNSKPKKVLEKIISSNTSPNGPSGSFNSSGSSFLKHLNTWPCFFSEKELAILPTVSKRYKTDIDEFKKEAKKIRLYSK